MDKKHIILLLCAALIILIPFFLNNGNTSGTDDASSSELEKSGYTPWIESLWKPNDQMETILFGAQAAIGLIIIALFIGYYRKKQNS